MVFDVGGMTFLFGAAGGFKEVIQATGVGDYIAQQMMLLPLTPVAVAFCVAALVRIACLGSIRKLGISHGRLEMVVARLKQDNDPRVRAAAEEFTRGY